MIVAQHQWYYSLIVISVYGLFSIRDLIDAVGKGVSSLLDCEVVAAAMAGKGITLAIVDGDREASV